MAEQARHSIRRSVLAVTLITLLIKVLGLVKQMVIASCLGASTATDAFFIASGVMVSLAVMIFSGLAVPLLTVYNDRLISHGRCAATALLNRYLRVVMLGAVVLAAGVFALAPYVAVFLAPSYEGAQQSLLTHDLRLMSVVIVLWAWFLSVNVVLETDKEFLPGRCQALFQNVFLIAACVLFAVPTDVEALLYAMIASGVAECLLVTWMARKRLFSGAAASSQSVRPILAAALPIVVGNAIYEVNDIVDKQIASSMGDGAVSQLVYGSTINDIVVGIIVMSVSTVLFSHFTTWAVQRDYDRLAASLQDSLHALTLLLLPLTAFFIFGASDIVSVMFGRGRFSTADALATASIAICYSLGFLFASYRAILTRVFYAFKDTRSPFVNGIVSVAFNVVLSLTLAHFIGVGGIALATSAAMLLSFALYQWQLRRHLATFRFGISKGEWCRMAVATALVSTALYFVQQLGLPALVRLVIDAVATLLLFVGAMVVLRSKLLVEQWHKLKRQ